MLSLCSRILKRGGRSRRTSKRTNATQGFRFVASGAPGKWATRKSGVGIVIFFLSCVVYFGGKLGRGEVLDGETEGIRIDGLRFGQFYGFPSILGPAMAPRQLFRNYGRRQPEPKIASFFFSRVLLLFVFCRAIFCSRSTPVTHSLPPSRRDKQVADKTRRTETGGYPRDRHMW